MGKIFLKDFGAVVFYKTFPPYNQVIYFLSAVGDG